MPAISFDEEWLDPLLSSTKQTTTRPLKNQLPRLKIGDIVSIYNQQREPKHTKALRLEHNPGHITSFDFAHLLGKVEIIEVTRFEPLLIEIEALNTWARKDGFKNFDAANEWFTKKYNGLWMYYPWVVYSWDGWLERYFEPKQQKRGQ